MVFAQLADQSDMIGRLLAIEQLADHHDKKTVAKLKQALNEDSFFGVRVEAAKALRTIHTDEALAALLDSGKQSDARVRRAVVSEVGGFFRDTAGAFTLKVLAGEKNPAIESAAIQNLGAYGTPEVHAALLKFLDSQSYREELAGAAIMAIRAQDDPAYIAPLLATLTNRQAELPTRVFAQGLGTLAYLARNEEKKDDVREFLIAHVNDKKKSVQRRALDALGTLGDPKAGAVLETFATAAKDSPERTAADQALVQLRASRKPADDFKNLRTEVMDLQKANRSLRKDFDDLKKQIEAQNAAPGKKRKTSSDKDSSAPRGKG
jgi:aminopeptidase N